MERKKKEKRKTILTRRTPPPRRLNGVKQYLNKVSNKSPNAEVDFIKYIHLAPPPPRNYY